jgi:hypothetical protein
MTHSRTIVGKNEFDEIQQWWAQHKSDVEIPEKVAANFGHILKSYESLIRGRPDQKALLRELNLAMGLTSKSEKGCAEKKL